MSDFISCVPGRVVSQGLGVNDVYNFLKKDFLSAKWRIISEFTTSIPCQMYLLPSEGEEVGNEFGRDVLMVEIYEDRIEFRPISEAIQGYPQLLLFNPKEGGKNAAEITVGGVKITQELETLTDANTPEQNLRYLYEALVQSENPTITGWNWSYLYPAPQGVDATTVKQCLIGVKKDVVDDLPVDCKNVTGGLFGKSCKPCLQSSKTSKMTLQVKANIDLKNGFIYFLQINRRGMAFATRLNTAYSGPIHACWGDHSIAIKQVPDTRFKRFISPLELIVGTDNDSITLGSVGRTSKTFGISPKNISAVTVDALYDSTHPFSHINILDNFVDCQLGAQNINTAVYPQSSGLWSDDNVVGNDFQIHRATIASTTCFSVGTGSMLPESDRVYTYIPTIVIDDWYKFRGTATDENLQLTSDVNPVTTLKAAINRVTDYPSIEMESVVGMPKKGIVIIENEAFEYQDISGTALMGVIRAKYATVKAYHAKGSPVYQGQWFIKINGGALLCGPVKP